MEKRMIALFYVIFLCAQANVLEGMENNDDKISIKLATDGNKTYSIARWKLVQELSKVETLSISGVTEQNIALFDKQLDEIDLEVVQKNNDQLKHEIKKRIIDKKIIGKNTIMGVHFPAYKEVFDYLLVAMIADNIRNNRVEAEEAYSFKPRSVNTFWTENLYTPPIEKLGLNTFSGRLSLCDKGADSSLYVRTDIPLSTMTCTGLSVPCDECNVHVYDTKKEYSEPKYIGTVKYNAKNINGLGVTTDLRYLVATFDNMLVSKAALYSDEDYNAYKEITHNIKLADIYLLLHLHKAKQQGCQNIVEDNEREYIRDYVATSEKAKELIKKHFL